jgi:hypothetical protein
MRRYQVLSKTHYTKPETLPILHLHRYCTSELDRFHVEAKGLSVNPAFPKLGVYPTTIVDEG